MDKPGTEDRTMPYCVHCMDTERGQPAAGGGYYYCQWCRVCRTCGTQEGLRAVAGNRYRTAYGVRSRTVPLYDCGRHEDAYNYREAP